MNEGAKVAAALGANLHWYDALCGAHGSPGESFPTHWLHRGEVPPYHSRFVTTEGLSGAAAQLTALRELMEDGRGFSVKDSFETLELANLGFEELFRATWIFRPAGLASLEERSAEEPTWAFVESLAELELWERVWRGVSDNEQARTQSPVFVPSLLERSDLSFLLGWRGAQPVATAALNASARGVGLSNVFSSSLPESLLYPGLCRAAVDHYPGLDVVGYERGMHLEAAISAGFKAVGGLTVWSWTPNRVA